MFVAGQRVKCIDAKSSNGMLGQGAIYLVRQHDSNGLMLQNTSGLWDPLRFELDVDGAPAARRPVQYSERIDAVIYDTPITATFTREDWVRLALAALDQANVQPDTLARAYRDARGKTEGIIEELT